MQGWQRLDRLSCKVQWDMYGCKHKRRHPERFHLLHLFDLHAVGEIHGQTVIALTEAVQAAYERWHTDRLYCVRVFLEREQCVHIEDGSRALYVTTKTYLEHLGYVEHYQPVGDTWLGLWEKTKTQGENGMTDVEQLENGISLRDWIAGQTAAVIMGNLDVERFGTTPTFFELTAKDAYSMADALLKARGEAVAADKGVDGHS